MSEYKIPELLLTECDCCGTEIEESDITIISNGDGVCLYCIDNKYTLCGDCDEYSLNIELCETDEYNNVCESCISGHYTRCDWCDRISHNDYIRQLSHDIICLRCWDNDVIYCEDCGDPYHYEQISNGYCEECAEDNRSGNYNYDSSNFTYFKTVRETRYNGNLLYFGIELEVGSNSTSRFYDLISEYSPRIVMLTDDCSIYDSDIRYGVELVSHPATFNWLKDNRCIWSDILKAFRQNGVQSFSTASCGIHIHLSKNCFTHSHLYNFLKIIYENPKFTKFISQRGSMGYRWCSIKNEADREMIAKKADSKSSWEKYTAVNLVHDYSVEVRIFRGNLNERSFYKNIQYLHALFMFTKDFSRNNSSLTIDNYLRYVAIHKFMYNDLYEWLKEKGKINHEKE